MNNTEEVREAMLAKYRWAEASVESLKENLSKDLKLADYDFWAFLTAYQTIRFYHGKWCGDNGRKGQATQWIDAWKSRIASSHCQIWDTINDMRNLDTHAMPLYPTEYVISQAEYPSPFYNSPPIIIKSIKHIVLFRGKQYPIKAICKTGLKLLAKFIDDFDE